MDDIKAGDLVEETGKDSGQWLVTEVFRNTPKQGFAARLVLPHKPDCVTYVSVDRLTKVD